MFVFILKRLLWGIPVLFVVATITFILMHIVPGGPFDQEKVLPPEIKANVEAKHHLDKPIWMQYALYIFGLMKGDLGPSYKYPNRTINDIRFYPHLIIFPGVTIFLTILAFNFLGDWLRDAMEPSRIGPDFS